MISGRRRLRWLLLAVPASFVLMTLGGPSTGAAPGLPPIGWSSGPNLPGAFGARWDYSVAYFPPTDQVVVFGGAPDQHGGVWKNDTWLYSVSTDSWSQGPAAPPALKPRSGAAMTFDPAIGEIVLFGGAGTEWPPYSDTWLFNGTSWTQGPAAPAAMGGRVGPRMVYADSLAQVVLFGGSGTTAYADTWLFNGTSWTAGPASPPAMASRTFFGMAYDQTVGKVIVAGGTGGADVWMFDGSTWAAGPSLPEAMGLPERFQMVYDPQLGADVIFGGIGPVGAHGDAWIFKPASQTYFEADAGVLKPGNRMDASMVWVASKDALMLIGGETDQNDGEVLGDTWFFRDVAPSPSSLTITPSNPDMTMKLTMVAGNQIGGYGKTFTEMQWYVNGVLVPEATGETLLPVYHHGDVVVAKQRLRDSLDLQGPWVSSPPVTIINRAPGISTISLSPSAPVMTDTIQAYVVGVDADGDFVSFTYAWTVNGGSVGGNTPQLTPAFFKANDVVAVTATPVDSLGLAGPPATAPSVPVAYNLTIDPAVPGGKPRTQGKGYTPSETVDMRIDSASGPILGSWAVDGLGRWTWVAVALPAELTAGTHTMYATGRSSGKVGQGLVSITPAATITPSKLAAGATLTWSGVGFMPGENISVAFPGRPGTPAVANANGSATLALVAPPAPNIGGVIAASAPSGTVQSTFTVTSVLMVPATGAPGSMASVSVTGYGSSETVNFVLDSGSPVASGATDANGSLSAAVPLSGFFGKHTIISTGLSTGIVLSKSIQLPAILTLSPTSGPRGTVVTITSGPGWKPNETLRFTVGARTMTSKTADANGSITFTYVISSQDPLGPLQIKLYSAVLKQTARSPFTVTG
jgi:galactose oxidase-like protein